MQFWLKVCDHHTCDVQTNTKNTNIIENQSRNILTMHVNEINWLLFNVHRIHLYAERCWRL